MQGSRRQVILSVLPSNRPSVRLVMMCAQALRASEGLPAISNRQSLPPSHAVRGYDEEPLRLHTLTSRVRYTHMPHLVVARLVTTDVISGENENKVYVGVPGAE